MKTNSSTPAPMSGFAFFLTGEEALAELPHLYNDAGELIDYDEDQAIREESRSKIEANPLALCALEAVLHHHHEDGGSVVEISSSLGDVGKLVGDYLGSLADHALSTAVRERRLDAGVTVVVPLTKRKVASRSTKAESACTASGGGVPTLTRSEIVDPGAASRADLKAGGSETAEGAPEGLSFTLSEEDFLDTLPLLYDSGTGELAPPDPPEALERMRVRIEDDDVARPLLRFAVAELHHRQGISIGDLRSDLMHAAERVGDYLSGLLYDAAREELLLHAQAGRLPRTVSVPTTDRDHLPRSKPTTPTASGEPGEPVTPEQVQQRMGEMARALRGMETELAELLERMPEHDGYREEIDGPGDRQSTATMVRCHLAAWADGGPLRDAADQLEDTAEERQEESEGGAVTGQKGGQQS